MARQDIISKYDRFIVPIATQKEVWETLVDIEKKYGALSVDNDFIKNLRHISRLYGLPAEFKCHLLKGITDPSMLNNSEKTVLAQVIKYAVVYNFSFVSIDEIRRCIDLVLVVNNSFYNEDCVELMSELAFIACKLTAENNDEIKRMMNLFPDNSINSSAKAMLAKLYNNLETRSSHDAYENSKYDEAVDLRMSKRGGLSTLRVKQNACSVKEKTQQRIVNQQKDKESDKEELTNVNLLNALNARSKSIQKSRARETLPDMTPKSGSDKAWYRNTYFEVKNFLNKATAREAISNEDEVYLIKKLDNDEKWFTISSDSCNEMIAKTFYHMSCNQRIRESHVNTLVGLVDVNSTNSRRVNFNKWVLMCVEKCCNRNSEILSKSIKNKLYKLINSDQTTLRNLASKILTMNMSVDSIPEDEVRRLFKNAIESLKRVNDRENGLEFINNISLNENKCKNLFLASEVRELFKIIINRGCDVEIAQPTYQPLNFDFDNVFDIFGIFSIPKIIQTPSLGLASSMLSSTSTSTKKNHEFANQIAEVMENYLQHESTPGLDSDSLNRILNLAKNLKGDENSLDIKLKLSIIRMIARTLSKTKGIGVKEEFMLQLVDFCACDEAKYVGIILLALTLTCETVNIPNVEHLGPKLTSKETFNLNTLCSSSEDATDSDDNIYISALVAELILSRNKCKWKREEKCLKFELTLSLLMSALNSSTDKQTRIRVAEILYYAVKGEELSELILIELKSFLNDSCPDIEVYAKATFVAGVLHLSTNCNDSLPACMSGELPQIYVFEDTLCLDDVDFSREINKGILKILKIEAKKAGNFDDSTFQLLCYLILNNSDENDVCVCLSVLQRYCECDFKKAHSLPNFVMETVESSWLGIRFPNLKTFCERILTLMINRGHTVSFPVLEKFVDRLYSSDKILNSWAFQLLFKCNSIQDLPDDIFYSFCVELIGVSMLLSLDLQNSLYVNIATKYSLCRGLGSLRDFILKGFKMTNLNFLCIQTCVSRGTEFFAAIECLCATSENGQILSSEVLDALNEEFADSNYKILIRLSLCILKNNQNVPPIIVTGILNCFLAKSSDFGSAVEFIVAYVQNDNTVSEKIVDKLCSISSEQSNAATTLLALSNLAKYSWSTTVSGKLFKVFFDTITTSDKNELLYIVCKGIKRQLKQTGYYTLDDNQINTLVSLKSNSNDKNINSCLDSILCNFDLNNEQKFLIDLSNILDMNSKEFLTNVSSLQHGKLNLSVVQKIVSILQEHCDDKDKIMLLKILFKYFQDPNSEPLIKDFVDVFGNILTNSTNENVKSRCVNLIKTAVVKHVQLSLTVLEACHLNIDLAEDVLVMAAKNQTIGPELEFVLRLNRLAKNEDLTDFENYLLPKDMSSLHLTNSVINSIANLKNESVILKLAELFAVLITERKLNLQKMSPIFLKSFLSSKMHFSSSFLHCFYDVIKYQGRNHSDVIESKLVELFHHSKNSIGIIKCLVAVGINCELKPQTLNIFADLLVSEDQALRRLAFQGLLPSYQSRKCPIKFLLIVEKLLINLADSNEIQFEKVSSHFQSALEIIEWEIEQLQKKRWSNGTKQLDELDLKLLETLFSITSVDFSLLGIKPENEWSQELLISNFIDIFSNKADQFEVDQKLREVLNDWSEKTLSFVNEALFWLTENIRNSHYSAKGTIALLESIKTIPLVIVVDVLQKLPNNSDSLLEKLSMRKLIRDKTIKSAISVDACRRLAEFATNPKLARKLISTISEIENTQSIELLLSQIAESKIKTLAFSQTNLCFKDLKFEVQFQMLQNDLHQRQSNSKIAKGRILLFENTIAELLINGISYEQIGSLLQLKPKYSSSEYLSLSYVARMISEHQICDSDITEIVGILKQKENYKEWVGTVNQFIMTKVVLPAANRKKSIKQLYKEFLSLNENIQNLIPDSTIAAHIISGDFISELPDFTNKKICNWNASDIRSWAAKVTRTSAFANNHKECLAVTKRALFLCTGFHLTNLQIVCVSAALRKGSNGQLQQIATGSGKSAIIAILAVIFALRGHKVDIYTSNLLLAERDAESWAIFYSHFGLTCSANADKLPYISGEKTCYRSDIVYGEASQFMFDWLRDHYSLLGTLGGRNCDFALVDEVDSPFVDDCSKLSRLSSSLPGLDLIQVLYHVIWNRLITLETKLLTFNGVVYYVEGKIGHDVDDVQFLEFSNSLGDILKIDDLVGYIGEGKNLEQVGIHRVDDLERFCINHLEKLVKAMTFETISGFDINDDDKVKVPSHLIPFVRSQIRKWVENAIIAFRYQENVHYVVEDGQIKPVDHDSTGVIQGSTNWSDGLHQMLQIKHKLRVTSETITTNFLSMVAQFKKYSDGTTCNILGFTGTLGSKQCRSFLSEVYTTDTLIMPHAFFKNYKQLKDILVPNETVFSEQVVASALYESARKRGVLIICESIKNAERIEEQIKLAQKGIAIKLYTKNNSGCEHVIKRIHPGEIIVATNLATRGTDINCCEVEPFGGLHVCLTYVPLNSRVEEQAFGRTSRQGNCGSGQLIAVCSPNLIKLGNIREMRDKLEKSRILSFMKEDLQLINAKDECFSRFRVLRTKNSKIVKKYESDQKKLLQKQIERVKKIFISPKPTVYETNILQAIEERWALFLRRLDYRNIHPKRVVKLFELEIQDQLDLSKVNDPSEIIQSPFYHIAIGNDFYYRDSKWNGHFEKANFHFDKAIKLDKDFSAGALVGKAFFLLKGQTRVVRQDKHIEHYKTKAANLLMEALPLLQNEMNNCLVSQALINESNNELYKQLTTKVNILGSYTNSVRAALSAVHNSLRFVGGSKFNSANKFSEGFSSCYNNSKEKQDIYLREIDSDKVKTRTIEMLGNNSDNTFNLTFDNLCTYEDCGTHDQAIETLSVHNLERNVSVVCQNLNFENVMKIITSDIYLDDVSKDEALTGIDNVTKDESLTSDILRRGRQLLTGKLDFNDKNVTVDIQKTLVTSDNLPPNSNNEIVNNNLANTSSDQADVLKSKLSIENAKNELQKCKETDNLNIRIRNGNDTIQREMRYFNINIELTKLSPDKAIELLNCKSSDFVTIKIVTNLQKIIKFANRKECSGYELFVVQTYSNGTWTSTHLNSITEKMNCCFNHAFNDLESFSYLEVKNLKWDNAIDLIECCRDIGNVYIDLDFLSVRRQSIVDNRKIFKGCYQTLNLTYSNLGTNSASTLVPLIRKLNFPFTLCLNNLQYSIMRKIINESAIKQEDIEQKSIKTLSELFCKEWMPILELADFVSRGISLMSQFNEKQFVPWLSVISVIVLGSIQMALGGALICTGFGATVGMSLITEGAADLITAYRAYSTRQFSWTDYGKQKAVSMAISAVSMGLGALKDGAKGFNMMVKGVATEAVEQAGTKLIMNGKTLSTAIKVSGSKLKTLAFKQMGVAVGEAALREGLNCLVDGIVQFTMSQAKPQIVNVVENRVRSKFYDPTLLQLVKRYWAIESIGKIVILEGKVSSAMENITNPHSNRWNKEWDSVGWPLCRGILSDKKFLGNSFNNMMRLAGMLNGIKEIGTIVGKVYNEIVSKLNSEKYSIADILHRVCLVEKMADAREMSTCISVAYNEENGIELFTINQFPEKYKRFQPKVVEVFKKLENLQSDFRLDSISDIIRIVVESIADHIIRITDTQLISPMSTLAVGYGVKFISEKIQSNFIVNRKQNTDELNESNAKNITVAMQITANAKEYCIAYQQREIIWRVTTLKATSKGGSNNKINKDIFNEALQTSLQGCAKFSTMFTLAAMNGLEIKIVDSLDYEVTQEDRDANVKIVVCEQFINPLTGKNEEGHYSFKNSNGEIVDLGIGGNNCGFAVMEHLTGKSIQQLRNEAATFMLDNSKTFGDVLTSERWIHERYLNESAKYLGVGGKQRPRSDGNIERFVIIQPDVKKRDQKLIVNGTEVQGVLLTEELEVELGAGSYSGSSPKQDVQKTVSGMKELANALGKTRFVSGHIVSERLGGSGDWDNIAPMTDSLNRIYSCNAETHIINFLKDCPADAQTKLNMKVNVTYGVVDYQGQKYTIVDKLELTLSLNKPENLTPADKLFKEKFIKTFAENTRTKNFDRKGKSDRNPRFTATFTEANLQNSAKVQQRERGPIEESSSTTNDF